MSAVSRSVTRSRRRKRVRKKIRGTAEKPRLCIFRSSNHIYAQLIDDSTGRTLVGVASLSKELQSKIGKNAGNKEGAALVGAAIANAALNKKIRKVVFDRNGFLYHGRVRALSEAARASGLEF
jgi:large subunit ribosomal protein L18